MIAARASMSCRIPTPTSSARRRRLRRRHDPRRVRRSQRRRRRWSSRTPRRRRSPGADRASNGARSGASSPTACSCRRRARPRRRPRGIVHLDATKPGRRTRVLGLDDVDLRPRDHAEPTRRDVHRGRRARARRALRRCRAEADAGTDRTVGRHHGRDRGARPLSPVPRAGDAGDDGPPRRSGWRSGSL